MKRKYRSSKDLMIAWGVEYYNRYKAKMVQVLVKINLIGYIADRNLTQD